MKTLFRKTINFLTIALFAPFLLCFGLTSGLTAAAFASGYFLLLVLAIKLNS